MKQIVQLRTGFMQKNPGAIFVSYQVELFNIPSSFLDLLLLDPAAIVDAVDGLFKTASDLTLGKDGIVTKFQLPFVGTAVSRSLKAGTSDHFLEKARRSGMCFHGVKLTPTPQPSLDSNNWYLHSVVGTLEDILFNYGDDGGNTTAADLIANVLTDKLGNELGILSSPVSVTYYEHTGGSLVRHDSYNEDIEVKSLMWEIPLGQTYTIALPPLNFDIGIDNFPLKTKMKQTPSLSLEWAFKLAFGFDEEGTE